MNIKVSAALHTAKVLGLCGFVGFAVSTIVALVPAEYIGTGFLVAALILAVRLCYSTEKARLEALEKLNNIK